VVIGGKHVGDYVLYHDISELQRQRRYHEALLDVSPTAIVTLDKEGRITSWNPAAERMFGFTPEEAIGKEIDDLVARSEEIREEAFRITMEGRTSLEKTHAITRRTRKDGTLIDVEVGGVPVGAA